MGSIEAPRDELTALEDGRAFADLSDHRKVRVSGGDARGWLHDLVTCHVASLEPGHARRSLLLTPTGRIRADFAVGADEEGFLLLQPPDQPEHVGLLLGPYVLSSDVSLQDATNAYALFAVLGRARDVVAWPGLVPSVTGPGVDVVVASGKPAWRVEESFVKHDLVEVGEAALEVHRIRQGIARMGVDYEPGALPAEAGLGSAIDDTKGCFLGQESVARVRNLGHPPRVLRHVRTEVSVEAGIAVVAGGEEVGVLTSAAPEPGGGTVAIARIGWDADRLDLTTASGGPLVAVGSMG